MKLRAVPAIIVYILALLSKTIATGHMSLFELQYKISKLNKVKIHFFSSLFHILCYQIPHVIAAIKLESPNIEHFHHTESSIGQYCSSQRGQISKQTIKENKQKINTVHCMVSYHGEKQIMVKL